jgi:outer membrane biosynthesis protein TonB
LREERKPLLAAQDVEYLKALEVNGDTSEIIKEKKRLRDITKLADAATTLDELKELKAEKPKPPEPIIPVDPVVPDEPVLPTDPILPTPPDPVGPESEVKIPLGNLIVRID